MMVRTKNRMAYSHKKVFLSIQRVIESASWIIKINPLLSILERFVVIRLLSSFCKIRVSYCADSYANEKRKNCYSCQRTSNFPRNKLSSKSQSAKSCHGCSKYKHQNSDPISTVLSVALSSVSKKSQIIESNKGSSIERNYKNSMLTKYQGKYIEHNKDYKKQNKVFSRGRVNVDHFVSPSGFLTACTFLSEVFRCHLLSSLSVLIKPSIVR